MQHGGGTTRSSDEVSVKGWSEGVVLFAVFDVIQPEMGGHNE